MTAQTGLLLDPYFSGTKVKWLLDTVPGARGRAAAGELLFGTIDTFLIWRLTEGRVHATDATNAARTLLFDIHKGQWSREICDLLDIPQAILPDVRDCAADFGSTSLFGGGIPILGVAGDQQAATIGQACFQPGMMKSTYGTGCFALLNTGAFSRWNRKTVCLPPLPISWMARKPMRLKVPSSSRVQRCNGCATRCRLSKLHRKAVSWLQRLTQTSMLFLSLPSPGLGAPYWKPDCRGAIFGLTRNSGRAEIARATLESIAFQTRDLWHAMQGDWGAEADVILRVDGGMSASDWAMQGLSDILGAPVDRPVMQETTALGAAWLAGMKAGVYPDQAGFAETWDLDRRFEPVKGEADRNAAYARWQRAVQATMAF